VDIQKLEINAYYKIFANEPLTKNLVIKILGVEGDIIKYCTIDEPIKVQNWNFKKFPCEIHIKLSPLEIELL